MADIITELKHCPFCGRIWMFVDEHPGGYFSVRCKCGATGPKEKGRRKALKAWNTRDQHLLWNPFRLSIRFPNKSKSVDLKGNLDSLDLATILQMLSSKTKTGILQLNKGYIKSVICLKDGNIIAASDSKGLRMGQILYKNGLISNRRLRNALKVARESGKILGEVLLSLKYVSQKTLQEVIHQQVQEAVLEMFLWREGIFEYRDCEVEFVEEGVVELNAMEVIMESARRLEQWDELNMKEKRRNK